VEKAAGNEFRQFIPELHNSGLSVF